MGNAITKEEKLKQLRKELHARQVAAFYEESYANTDEARASNKKIADGIREIADEIAELEKQ